VRGNGSGSFRARDILAGAEVCRDDDAREVRGPIGVILPPVASAGRGR
jgi:hypothetical protein